MDAPYTLSTDVFWVGGGYMGVKNNLRQHTPLRRLPQHLLHLKKRDM